MTSSSSTTSTRPAPATRGGYPAAFERSRDDCRLLASAPSPAPVAQGIEHRPPEAGAQVRILPGAPTKWLVNRLQVIADGQPLLIFPSVFHQLPSTRARLPRASAAIALAVTSA